MSTAEIASELREAEEAAEKAWCRYKKDLRNVRLQYRYVRCLRRCTRLTRELGRRFA